MIAAPVAGVLFMTGAILLLVGTTIFISAWTMPRASARPMLESPVIDLREPRRDVIDLTEVDQVWKSARASSSSRRDS